MNGPDSQLFSFLDRISCIVPILFFTMQVVYVLIFQVGLGFVFLYFSPFFQCQWVYEQGKLMVHTQNNFGDKTLLYQKNVQLSQKKSVIRTTSCVTNPNIRKYFVFYHLLLFITSPKKIKINNTTKFIDNEPDNMRTIHQKYEYHTP